MAVLLLNCQGMIKPDRLGDNSLLESTAVVQGVGPPVVQRSRGLQLVR